MIGKEFIFVTVYRIWSEYYMYLFISLQFFCFVTIYLPRKPRKNLSNRNFEHQIRYV